MCLAAAAAAEDMGAVVVFVPLSVPIPTIHMLHIYLRRTHAIMAAILHDVVDDTSFSISMIGQSFGQPVAKLVDTVTKISQLNQLMRRYKRNLLLRECKATEQQLRNLLLDSVDDPLVLLIKLADRLHNMRTVYVLSPLKRVALAKETLNVWCPLAERLGLFPLKAELEDLCFAVLHPEDYADIRTQLDELWGLDASVRLQRPEQGSRVEQVDDAAGFADDMVLMTLDEDVAQPVPDVIAPALSQEQLRSRALLESVVPFDQTRFSSEVCEKRGNGYRPTVHRMFHQPLPTHSSPLYSLTTTTTTPPSPPPTGWSPIWSRHGSRPGCPHCMLAHAAQGARPGGPGDRHGHSRTRTPQVPL